MSDITILSSRTEERPYYHDFIKNDFIGECPSMAKINYDPFPEAKLGDVVRREIICRELLWFAKLKGDVFDIKPGVAVDHEGHRFAITSAHIDFTNETSEVEGSEFLTPCEPMKTLALLRRAYAEKGKA